MLKKLSQSSLRRVPERDDFAEPSVISLAQILRFLRNYRGTIILSVFVPVSLALFYCLTTTPIFTARAQALLDPQTPQPMQESASNGNATYDSPQVESQMALLRSEKIALTVAGNLKLFEDPEFGGDPAPPADEDEKFSRQQHVLNSFLSRLDVRRVGVSYAIDISFSSEISEKASTIANALAAAFVQDQLATRADAVRAGSEWLEQRIELLRKQMNASSLKVQEFKVKRDYRISDRVAIDAELARAKAAMAGPGPQAAPAPQAAAPVIGAANSPDAVTLEELESTSQTYRRIYESYLQAYTESLQRQSLPVSNVRVITWASKPLSKSHPKTVLILVLAGLVGAMIGFGLAIIRHNYEGDRNSTT